MMLKNKKFRAIALRTLCFQVLSGTVACWMAFSGWGIYALLVSPLVSSVGVFGYNFYNYPQKPVWPIDMVAIKRVWSYSAFQFLFSVINYFSRNIDTLIIGKYLSMKELGYYDKSYRLMQMPLANITHVITPVLHPILSSLQDDKSQLAEKNNRLTKSLSWISFPLGIILYFCAGPIIRVIFGDNWIPAVPVFKILAFSVPLQIMTSTSGSIFQAAGKTNHLFYCGIQSSICTVGAFVFAAIKFHTIEAMAWAWVIASTINFAFAYFIMYRLTFQTSIINFYRGIVPQIINSAVTIFIVWLTIQLYIPSNLILEVLWVVLLTGISTVLMATVLHQYSFRGIVKRLLRR